jgi:hypothetical protein
MTRRQWGMALMAVGLVVGWVGTEAAAKGNPALNACNASLGTCTADLGMCNTDLTQAEADLSACLAAAQKFPATGQTTCWDSSNLVTACTNTPGEDGAIQAGATLSYYDNGDGTITDNNTGLMWEKLCDEDPPGTTCPAEHDVDTTYNWADAFGKIAALNAGTGFAGHTDWRLPNVKELQSIVNYENNVALAVSSAFDTGCVASCNVTTCSCTAAFFYWSSSTFAGFPALAWIVGFNFGFVGFFGNVVDVVGDKSGDSFFVRAVRGGL